MKTDKNPISEMNRLDLEKDEFVQQIMKQLEITVLEYESKEKSSNDMKGIL